MPYRTPYGIEDADIVRAMRSRSRLQLSTRCRVFCGTCNDTSPTCPDCPDMNTSAITSAPNVSLTPRPGRVVRRLDTQGPRDRLDRVDTSVECVVHVDTSRELPLEIPEPSREGEWSAKLHPAFDELGDRRGMWLTARWHPAAGYTAEGECETFVSSCEAANKLLRARCW